MNDCFEGWKSEDGNSGGRCCCNCEHQRPIMSHPWNKVIGKGSITQQLGWGCIIPDLATQIIFFEGEHGMCECHDWRDYSKYSAEHTTEALKNVA